MKTTRTPVSKVNNSSMCPKAFVLGHPIRHSKSPLLHQAAYRVLGEPISYRRLETSQEQLEQVFASYGPSDGTRGFSVTMPLKEKVKDYLDRLTPLAQLVGVVNTVYWRPSLEGRQVAWGHNSDLAGIVNALRQAGFEGAPLNPAILGGGSTARAALTALALMGARQVHVLVRDASRAAGLEQTAQTLGVRLLFAPLSDFAGTYESYDVLISSLPAGAADHLLDQAPQEPQAGLLLDVSYDPWPSPLALAWEARGGLVTSGLEMLVYQALDQVKLFSGRPLGQALPQQEQVLAAMRQAVGLEVTGFVPEILNHLD